MPNATTTPPRPRSTRLLQRLSAASLPLLGALLGCSDEPTIFTTPVGGGQPRPGPAASTDANGGVTAPGRSRGEPASATARVGAPITGPSASGGPSAGPADTASTPPASADAGGLPSAGGDEQAWVFDQNEVHTYELTLDPEVWAALQVNARDEEYAEARLEAAGQSLGSVGLRFKGNLGTLVSCFDEDGTPRCSKLSMKLKFDEYVSEQRFFGLKRLNFNSMIYDDSLLQERLAYRVYREMGVIAPRAAHARLVVNGEDWGVFSLVEEVDGRFTKHHFDGGDGNVYKEAWPSNASQDLLSEALQTNEDAADHGAFLEFQADLLAAAPEELRDVVADYLDVDASLAYLAVDQALINWDGVTTFFCYDDQSCDNHNYYWYQDEVDARFTLVPWDLDNTFETESPLAGVPGLFDDPGDCSARYEATGRLVMAPGCDPLLRGLVDAGRARYRAQLDRLLEGPLAPGILESWIDAWQAQLQPEVLSDSRGPDPDVFADAVERLRRAVDILRERARLARDDL